LSAVHPLQPGARIGHYRLEERLGGGGMGDVYKAHDTSLGRPVALKFLRPDTAGDPRALERLRFEARTASALNHPNICTIYEIGEQDGRTYIAMEFLEGESLREHLRRGAMAPARLLDAAIQIAAALEAAHAKEIIHRDIKPENVFLVPEGRVKILDFGVARRHETREVLSEQSTELLDPHLTLPGMVLGTPAYMSPEQVRGEDLDARTDLYSLGSVLFEMAAGRPAFEGRTHADLSAAVLGPAPELPVDLATRFRGAFQRIVSTCLEKARDLRYQHASDLAADLKRLKRDLEVDGPHAVGRPLPIAGAPVARPAARLAADLAKAMAFAALVIGAHTLVHRRPSAKYLDQFQIAFAQESVGHAAPNDVDFQVGGRQLPLLVDISRLHPDKKQRTDRRMLDALVDELRAKGARAVGLDLIFDDLQGEDFQYLQKWTGHKNVRVGIYRRAVERREAWLGRPEFAPLAAGIALPADNPQQAYFYSRRWFANGATGVDGAGEATDCANTAAGTRCREDLVQLPVALWLLSERERLSAEDPADDAVIEARLKTVLQAMESRSTPRQVGSAVGFGEYGIDYSHLNHIRQDVVTLWPVADGEDWEKAFAGARLPEGRIADRVVLVGDLEDTSDHSCPTPSMKPVSGVLIHACSLATLNRGMVFQVTDALGWTTVIGGAFVLAAAIVGLRLLYARSKPLQEWPYQYLEIPFFGTLALVLFVVFDWRVRNRGVVWPHTMWLCGALLAHPFVSEPLCRAVASTGALVRTAARTLTGRRRGV
jgi:predicted Ser/Thr protein kinase